MIRIFCVWLRQPYDKEDPRTDPKYEEGSFGSTGCHSANLLSEKGYRQKRIQKGDRIVFIQSKKIVFITPQLERIDKNKDGYVVVHWNPNWNSRNRRPLKLNYAINLDEDHARMLNPNVTDPKKIASHLRNYSQPSANSEDFVKYYEKTFEEKRQKYGDMIFVERCCQTYCERNQCEGCFRYAESEHREETRYSPRKC